ncbi:MAG: YbaB/EbfC family nucleoid-associated protein [Candidatus Woykebacteria bacterium]
MFDKLKQMYELKRKADQIKKDLESEVIDVEVGDVKVRINAAQKIQRIDFPDGVEPDKLKDAVNKALDEAQKIAAKRMQGMMGGMDGLQDLLKG